MAAVVVACACGGEGKVGAWSELQSKAVASASGTALGPAAAGLEAPSNRTRVGMGPELRAACIAAAQLDASSEHHFTRVSGGRVRARSIEQGLVAELGADGLRVTRETSGETEQGASSVHTI